MKKYKHVFFDLDRTIWDFEKNSGATIKEILNTFNLADKIPDESEFVKRYHIYNEHLWSLYRENKITKPVLRTERFRLLINDYNISSGTLVDEISKYYIENTPRKPFLIDGAKSILEYLNPKYQMHIISNGFTKSQFLKLKSADIAPFFRNLYTSEMVGVAKPDRKIFEYAIKSSNARKSESIFIGDDILADINGARQFGIDQVWFNPAPKKLPSTKATFEISHLSELKNIL